MNKHRKSPIGVVIPFRAKNLVMLLSGAILSLQVQAGVTNNPPPPAPPKPNPPCRNSAGNGMAICIVDDNIHAALRIIDTPLLNTAPIGPETSFQLSYVSRGLFDIYDGSAGGNIGVGWWHNWRAWIEDSGTPLRPPVSINSRDRGNHYYSGFNEASGTFTPEPQTQAVLQWVPESPQRYIRRLPDGSMEIYQHLYIAKNESRRFMLSAVVDKFGNSVKLNYDTSSRLISLTDAVGRVTRFDYQNQAFPERITQVTDFGGRSIQLKYSDTGNLQSITDVIGIESRFNYVADGVIDALTTPYGTTRFESGRDGYYWWLQVTDPMGNKERQEFLHGAPGIPFSVDNSELPDAPGLFNQYINARNSYHWNKTTMRQMGNSRDYTRAHIKHWLHATNDVSTPIGVLESEKAPLESRVWYTYANQLPGMASSTSHQPIAVARKMPDGSTQLEKYEYSGTGNLAKRTDPVGRVTEWAYHPNGTDVATVRQSAGVQQEMIVQSEYDAHHLPVAVTNAAGGTSRFSYNQFGQVISETNPAGEVLKYEYDNQGQLVRVINQEGRIQISYQWDAMGRVASQTDAEGYTVRHSYDALNRKIRSEYPDDTAEVFEWRALDLIAQTNRAGQTTRFEYDANRRLIAKTDPSGRTLRYEYDPDGNLTALTDGKGQTTRWDRDIQGRVIRKIFPGGGIIQYQYDSVGRLVSQIDVAGNKASLNWTIDNQLAGKTYQPAAGSAPVVNVSYQYDTLHPRITRMLDSGGVTDYIYQRAGQTGAGQLVEEQMRIKDGAAVYANVKFKYDILGRNIEKKINDYYVSKYTYDSLGRIGSMQNALGLFIYQYLGDTTQQIKEQRTSASLQTTFSWMGNKQDRQLQQIRFASLPVENGISPANDMYSIQYQFDALGRMQKRTENNAADEFSYDAVNRLIGITNKKNDAWFGKATANYEYDEADNIVRLQDNSGKLQFTHNNDNFLQTQQGTLNQIWRSDLNGNVLEDADNTYQWDAANQLYGLTSKRSLGSTTFLRDGLGRMSVVTEAGNPRAGTTRYLWCGMQSVTPCAQLDSNGIVKQLYFLQGEWRADKPQAQAIYYQRDHLGSVRYVTDVNGKLIGTQDYSAYGAIVSRSGVTGQLGYAGMWQHETSGLNLTWYRPYNPRVGRWLSRDPIGEEGGLNLFGYVSADPINKKDPSGLLEQCRTGLDLFGGRDIGPLHHEYLCWTEANGTRVCRGFGRERGTSIADAVIGTVEGKILKDDENVSHNNEKCEPDDKNKCEDQCAKRHWDNLEKGATPRYGIIFGGSCQIAKQNIYQSCVKECRGRR